MTNEELILGWSQITQWWKGRFDKAPDLNAILFMIGIRELGQVKEQWKKEEKMDVMHIAICSLLSTDGYYTLEMIDDDGWPHYDQIKELPALDIFEQEMMLKKQVIKYFRAEEILDS
ncbi:MAG: hypothetical protein EXR21_09560 [Flavobacteriaceae bacterium]|nr:hypothetical protein [Flavobacteriaceae bacterium]